MCLSLLSQPKLIPVPRLGITLIICPDRQFGLNQMEGPNYFDWGQSFTVPKPVFGTRKTTFISGKPKWLQNHERSFTKNLKIKCQLK